MSTCRDSRQLVIGVEDNLARGTSTRSVVDDQLHDHIDSAVGHTEGEILPLGRSSAAVTGKSGSGVAFI